MTPETTADLLSADLLSIFEWATGTTEDEVLHLVLNAAFFIEPDVVRQTPVQNPDLVRKSREWHPGKDRGQMSTWEGRPVRVCDNTHARLAFGKYIGRTMGGARRDVSIGWEVAHIWGRVYDPDYFTAGWNMILLPSFLRVLTEEQAQTPIFSRAIQAVAHRLFFAQDPVATPAVTPEPPDPTGLPPWLATFSPRLLRPDVPAQPEPLRRYAP